MRIAVLLCSMVSVATATEKVPAYGTNALLLVDDDAYIDPVASKDEIARVREDRKAARTKLADAIGPLESTPPREIYCKSDACKTTFSGPTHRSRVRMPGEWPMADGVVDRPTIVMARVGDITGTLMHEIFHLELRHRLGNVQVPAWFDEGLASHFGDNTPGCGPSTPPGIDDLRRLANGALWFAFTEIPGRIEPTYCQARHETEAWLAHGGTSRFVALVQKMRAGGEFGSLYGPMQTQPEGAFPTVVMSPVMGLGEPKRPFSFSLWVKPTANEGTLVHLSSDAAGTGWCTPFLGFDAEHALVAQVLDGSAPTAYTIARGTKPLLPNRWSHVAMTWAPDASLRLYVNGKEVAATPSTRYQSSNTPVVYVTWGSQNIAGPTACWQGTIASRRFTGDLFDTRVYDRVLDGNEIAALAKRRP